MPKLTFLPSNESYEVTPGTRVLGFAVKKKLPLQFGCAACRCGTCIIRVKGVANPMGEDEEQMLKRMGVYENESTVRLACRLLVGEEDLTVDLESQKLFVIQDQQFKD